MTPSPLDALSAPAATCCGRPVAVIEVTESDRQLVLRTCRSCGGHTWIRDGAELGRDEVLQVVRARLAETPARGRWAGKRPAVPARPALPAQRPAAD